MSFTNNEYPLTTNEYPSTVNEQSYQVNQNEKDNTCTSPVSIPLPAITRNSANNDLTMQYTPFSSLYTNSDYNDNGHSYVLPLSPRSPITQYTPTTPTPSYTSTSLHAPTTPTVPHHTSIQHTPTMQYVPIPQYTQYESMSQYTPTSQYTPMPQMSHHGANNDYIAPAMQYSPPCSCSNCSIPMQQCGHVIQAPQCNPQISAPMPIQQFTHGNAETQQFYSVTSPRIPPIPPQIRMNDSVPFPVVYDVYYVPRFNQRRNCSERMLPHIMFQNISYKPVFPQQERAYYSCSHVCPYCN